MVNYTTLNRVTGNELTSTIPQCMRMAEEFMYRHNPDAYKPVIKAKHKSLIAEPVHTIYNSNRVRSNNIGRLYLRPTSKTTSNMLTKLAAK